MILPKFTLLQVLRFTLVAGLVSVVLAGAWRNQSWALSLTLAGILALIVSILGALAYWCYFWLGQYVSSNSQRVALPRVSASVPNRDGTD